MSSRSVKLPSLTFARITTDGGPYRAGDIVSLAFDETTIARMLPHASADRTIGPSDRLVPDSVSATILIPADPYGTGDPVTLSFVDPGIARVHPVRPATSPLDGEHEIEPGGGSRTHSALRLDASLFSADRPAGPAPVTAMPDRFAGNGATRTAVDRTNDRGTSLQPAGLPERLQSSSPTFGAARSALRAPAADAKPADVHHQAALTEARVGPRLEAVMAARAPAPSEPAPATEDPAASTPHDHPSDGSSADDGAPGASRVSWKPSLYRIQLDWPQDRAGRFVRVVDKLFTVDRLGWYRHVLATRLLVAERILASEERADLAERASRATASIRLLRTAGLEALGAPLLAAYLPGFSVNGDWLATLSNETLSASLSCLCEELVNAGESEAGDVAAEDGTLGAPITPAIAVAVAASASRGGVDAALPYLIPTVASDAGVSAALSRYRENLLELFAQITPGAGAVRVRQMAQPNPVLDDRLWHLAGAVQQTLTIDAAKPA